MFYMFFCLQFPAEKFIVSCFTCVVGSYFVVLAVSHLMGAVFGILP